MKTWYTLIFGKNIVLRWNSFDSEFQKFIIIAILIGIFLFILFYVIIPTIKFIYKLTFDKDYRKNFKSDIGKTIYPLKIEYIKKYLSGNLSKEEKYQFIKMWIVYYLIYFYLTNLGTLNVVISKIVFIVVVAILLVGFTTHWLKKNNIKFSSPNIESKDKKNNDVADRLAKLKQLLDDNQISKEEYEEQRKKIIGDV